MVKRSSNSLALLLNSQAGHQKAILKTNTGTGEQEFIPGPLVELKNEAEDQRSANKAGVYCKETQAPHFGRGLTCVGPEAFCSSPPIC